MLKLYNITINNKITRIDNIHVLSITCTCNHSMYTI